MDVDVDMDMDMDMDMDDIRKILLRNSSEILKNKTVIKKKSPFLNEEEKEQMCQRYWKHSYPFPEADKFIEPFLKTELNSNESERKIQNIVRVTRKALFLSNNEMARRLLTTPQNYAKLEKSEEIGSLQIKNLRKIAEAMDCQLIYALKPKNNLNYSSNLWKQIHELIENHPWSKNKRPPTNIPQKYYFAKFLIKNSKVRKKLGWSQRITSDEGASIPF